MSNHQEKLAAIDRQLQAVQKKKQNRAKITGALRSVLEVCSLSIVLLIVFNFILGLARVNQNSMLPNFHPNDIVIYNRLDSSYERGDVIVAKEVNDDILIIKRIIGLPNETIDIDENGVITIDGVILQEESLIQGKNILRDIQFPLTLDDDEYFVLGDNREISLDSRSGQIGNIKKGNIRGTVFFTIKAFR